MIAPAISAALAKGYVLASMLACTPAAPPKVDIVFDNQPPVATHNLDHRQLGQFQPATQFSHHASEVFVTGGITESNIATGFDIRFTRLSNTFSRDTCLSLSEVKVSVSYAPNVHIASNYPEGSCRYKLTWLHELRHVNTDVITLKEFVPFYQKNVAAVVAGLKTQGPLPPDAVEPAQQKIAEAIKTSLESATEQMDKTRMQRQQLIDTREEYLRLSKACPGE